MAKATATKKATPKVVLPTERDIRIEHIISSAKEFNLSAGAVYRQFALMLDNDARTERYEATKHDPTLSKKEQRKLSGDAVAKLWADIYEIDQTYTTDSLSKICGVGGFLAHGIDNHDWTLLEIDLLLGFIPTYLQNNKLIRGLEKATKDGKVVACTVEALRAVGAFKPEPTVKDEDKTKTNNQETAEVIAGHWYDIGGTFDKLRAKIVEPDSCASLSVELLAQAQKELQALAQIVRDRGKAKAIELGQDWDKTIADLNAHANLPS